MALTDDGLRRHDTAFASHLPIIEREFGRHLTSGQQRLIAHALGFYWRNEEPETG